MQVSVSGKNIDVGSALKNHVEENISGAVNKYFDRAIDADVVFSKESHLFRTDIIVNEGTGKGVVIKSDAQANDIYASFDMATDRIEKQLRRYKRRLKNHHKKQHSELEEMTNATKYVISSEQDTDAEDDKPLIIAEKQTKIESLTVSDAVMRMNLANLPALMFLNKKNGAVNIVYQRKDGNISWVDPTP